MQELPDLTPAEPHSEPPAQQGVALAAPSATEGRDAVAPSATEGRDAVAPSATEGRDAVAPSAPMGGDAVPSSRSQFPSVPWGAEPSVSHHALPQVPWTQRDLVWSVIWGFGLMAVLAMLFAVALAAMQDVTGIQLPPAFGLVVILGELGLLLPVWWFGVRKYHLSWSAVGLRDFAIARGLGLGCMFLLFAFAANSLWSLFLSLFGLTSQTSLLPLFGSGFGGLLLALFTGGVVAPIAEEVFFRGFVFAGLYRERGLWPAVVLSSILFALVHITPTSWPPIFLLGVIFAVLYERTGSIWPAVAAHAAVNSLSFLLVYLLEILAR